MRLLPKQEVAIIKGLERKQAIDEGVTLAKKVDSLREVVAQEEANLAKFRIESLASIRDEIKASIVERDALSQEVTLLRQEKKILKIPLDEEWDMVKKEREELEEQKKQAILQYLKIEAARDKNERIESKLSVESDRVSESRVRADKYLVEADEKLRESERISSEADKEMSVLRGELETKQTELLSREAAIALQERSIQIRMSNIEFRELELNNKERSINDRYEALMRTESRIITNK